MTDICGTAFVAATDSPTVAWECDEISTLADDLGIDNDLERSGLYLWEGEHWQAISGGMDPSEPYTVYRGTIRGVLPEEIPALLAMRPPEEPLEDARD